MSPAFRQAPERVSDQWPGSPLIDTDSEDELDDDDYARAANAYEHPFSSEDEDDPTERHAVRRQIGMQLRCETDYAVNYVNIGGYGPMPYGYTEDTSGFEQLHETPGGSSVKAGSLHWVHAHGELHQQQEEATCRRGG